MNDTKWREVFEALSSKSLGLRVCLIKFVDSDVVAAFPPPHPHSLGSRWVYEGYGYESFRYREIEWLAVPRAHRERASPDPSVPFEIEIVQDADVARTALQPIGKLPVEPDERGGFRIVGYRR